ncbi:MAG: glycosyltransferase family 4 protein, partial [Anaerolineaceae bacterium]|nr:glycosyltransferase family 4 protein [Anaerolineaceae bacterium]
EWISIKQVVFLIPDSNKISERVNNLSTILQKQGCSVIFTDQASPIEENQPDVVIACNPHMNPAIMEKLAKYSTQNVPIILDLDDDFEYMPITHPDYTVAGLGSLEKSRSYTAAMLFANVITVPGESMAAHIRESGYKVEVIPLGWSEKSDQWHKQSSRRNSINIGLIGIQCSFEDVQKYRRIIMRVLREFPQTRLVVCGDSITYKMCENIPENRRVFLPSVPDDEMSYILGQIDILLIPLNTTPYHLVTTDQMLMQAGVKGIPWIASPMPDYIRWQAGGVTAENPDEWHSYLRQFVQDKELRLTLGQAGKEKSNRREETKIGKQWMEVINSIIIQPKKK